jgi:hypothetical protein
MEVKRSERTDEFLTENLLDSQWFAAYIAPRRREMSTERIKPARTQGWILQCLTALAVAAPLLVGCNDSSPTAPKLVTNPTPTPAPAGRNPWKLTDQVIAATGPGTCLYRPSVGMSFSTTFELVKSGNSVRFAMEDPFDWESYTATVNGTNFTATNPAIDSGSGMCVHYRQTTSLSGSFSEDGNQLTATEIWSLTLDSGEVVMTTFRWTASRI